jgi:hypothetical protein
VIYCIALKTEDTTFAETLIKPRAVEIATCVFGEQSVNKPESVKSFNNTVKLTIQNLSAHLEKQLVSRLKHSFAFRYNLTNH